MKIRLIANMAGGMAKDVELDEGSTVQDLFDDGHINGNPANFNIRVSGDNSEYTAADAGRELHDGDRVSMVPKKTEGARA